LKKYKFPKVGFRFLGIYIFKMVHLLLQGDPHYKTGNLREQSVVEVAVESIITSRPVDAVVLLGDILHTFRKVDVDPLHQAVKYIKRLAKSILVIVLIGNHDRKNNREFCGSNHPFVGLKGYPNVIIVDKPRLIFIKDKKILALPYVWKDDFGKLGDLFPKKYPKGPKETKKVSEYFSEVDVVLAHQDYAGRTEGGLQKSDGWKWDPTACLAISGHIHNFHFPQPNVCYLGTVLQENFGEDTDKAFGYLTLSTDPVVFQNLSSPDIYSNSSRGWKLERLRVPLPQMITFRMTINEMYTFDVEKVKQEKLFSLNRYRIVATGTVAEKKGVTGSILSRFREANIELKLQTVEEKYEASSNVAIPTPTSFSKRLYEKAREDPRKLKWFSQIYGYIPRVKIVRK